MRKQGRGQRIGRATRMMNQAFTVKPPGLLLFESMRGKGIRWNWKIGPEAAGLGAHSRWTMEIRTVTGTCIIHRGKAAGGSPPLCPPLQLQLLPGVEICFLLFLQAGRFLWQQGVGRRTQSIKAPPDLGSP